MSKLGVLLTVVIACAPASTPQFSGSFIEPTEFDTEYPEPPAVPDGPLDPSVENELGSLIVSIRQGGFETEALDGIVAGGDARVAWFLADLMRFFQGAGPGSQLARAFESLTGASVSADPRSSFVPAVNHLIAWDLPAWDGYDQRKREIYTIVEPRWDAFFEENVSIDWRLVTWGGVLIDDRPLGNIDPCPRGCIPALDDPPTVPADEGDWYPDNEIIFGVMVDDEALALPKNQMEVHEMVNLTLGGSRLGIPYCTLCGSAQAYLTESVPEGFDTIVLRTSGLLSRSNKVMYDLETMSVFDTFTGEALSGPLGEAQVVLEQVSVVASTWGEWKKSHPESRIIAQDGGIGRTYRLDPLGDRDADGPIFPVGPVDPRLPVQDLVVGVIAADGVPLAFPLLETRSALLDGERVGYENLEVSLDGNGLKVIGPDGPVTAHQAFWFAWSQFHPSTLVWSP